MSIDKHSLNNKLSSLNEVKSLTHLLVCSLDETAVNPHLYVLHFHVRQLQLTNEESINFIFSQNLFILAHYFVILFTTLPFNKNYILKKSFEF